MPTAPRVLRHRDGVPVFGYRTDPAVPPVSVVRMDGHATLDRPHIHAFPALLYVANTGLVYVVAADEVIDASNVDARGGVAVFFNPAALGGNAQASSPAWRSHPLLYPFVHGRSGALLELEVPPERRQFWIGTIAALDSELADERDGFRDAALAYLTLLLIDLARTAADVVGDLRRSGEPLLADVFAVIERRFAEPLSLRDVAREVGLTPGHLTTVVGRRTGRTVQEWITERRMTEARRLLAQTDLPVGDVARRVGFGDAGYFTRLFGKQHGSSPRRWRNARAVAKPD
ncbi:helix-turn-helix transcriptional regulator [Antrihabitans stalactiti]|uniref:Helix-turn-helix transcriptional regulator n=1 Tax=Antrihabitans stalactiti TaxID=2584121 RepID=A0A848KG45_9NOCA|nr:AraC family transcriptional regulator [Antrihabitans stalactiti]NMN96736.1 helix-turn-helix transcriptional regulator [Antrihabitans stalactiti]